MKKLTNLLRCATVSLAALFLCSCASTPGHQSHFHQQEACNAIVRFSSWDLITINKPDTRQAGFLPLYKQTQAEQVLARPDVARGMAVVICGGLFSLRQEADLQEKWAGILQGLGYQRVVFLRAGLRDQVNGLAVIRDMPLAAAQVSGG